MSTKGKMVASRESVGRMGDWKSRTFEKKGRASQSTGKSKGIVASALDKFMCRRNRSYKHPLFGAWCAKFQGSAVRGSKA